VTLYRRGLFAVGLVVVLLHAAAPMAGAHAEGSAVPAAVLSAPALSCSGFAGRGAPLAAGADYYAIELVPTGRVPGTRLSKGVAYQTASASPFFGVAVAPTGEYLHDLDVQVQGLKQPTAGGYVVWATDTNIQEVVRLGVLDESLRLQGQVAWNKFLVVITREPAGEPADKWQGPIVMRGMSRSGRMHTMAGHGPFEAEPCAKYGFR